MSTALAELDTIHNAIYLIRGQRVMLDSDLAALYSVLTGNLNKAVKRNRQRFPEDFMFQLTDEEWDFLIFHSGISKKGRGGRRFPPYAFTEHGVAMLSSVLNSEQAIAVNIQIVRAFVTTRHVLSVHDEFRRRFEDIESTLDQHDQQFRVVVEEIRRLMVPAKTPEKKIGF